MYIPQRPHPTDLNGYSKRLKQFGAALQNGQSVLVTKVKVKDKLIEYQLGGGYGTFGEDTDTSVHFTPREKSQHQKELEDQLSKETDPDIRRSLSRDLDNLRRERDRKDRREKARATAAAEQKKQMIASRRIDGGSRRNICYQSKVPADLTPQMVMATLAQYLTFPPETFGGGKGNVPAVASVHSRPERHRRPQSLNQRIRRD